MSPGLSRQLKGGIAALVFFLGLAWFSDLDLWVARLAFSPNPPHWPYQELQPWKLFYDAGEPPALICGLLGLLAFLGSFASPKFRPWRGPGLYLFVVLALGPGLLVNTLGKGLSGRPRPLELADFGGLWEFRRPLEFGVPGRGRSFLSGHASMGFYWMAFAFLLSGWRSKAALWTGLGLGCLFGAARILQGGHFFSDVALCGAAVYLVCALCSPLIRRQPGPDFFRLPWLKPALAAFALSWLLLANPVYEERHFVFQPRQVQGSGAQNPFERLYDYPPVEPGSANLSLSLGRGDIAVDFEGESGKPGRLPLRLVERFQGMALFWGKAGLPGRAMEDSAGWPMKQGDVGYAFEQRLEGLFWSAQASYTVSLPRRLLAEARLKTGQGSIRIAPLPEGRRTAVFGPVSSASLPEGFLAPGVVGGHLREGADPLLQLVLDSPNTVFE